MEQHELDAVFDKRSAGYDAQWTRMAPMAGMIHGWCARRGLAFSQDVDARGHGDFRHVHRPVTGV